MKPTAGLVRILKTAEEQCLAVLAEAAGAGNLEEVDKARRLVGELRALGLELAAHSQTENVGNETGAVANGATRRKSVAAKSKAIKGSGLKYPEFSIRHNTLYRRRWSQKKQSEYEHKAPRQTVDEVVRAMASLAAGDAKPVSVEAIVAKVNRSSTVSIPQYQVYSVIGWLRSAQQIEQVGRDGYRIPPEIAQKAAELWLEFSVRSSKNDKK